MAFTFPLILVAIYVNQLKVWIQLAGADCASLVKRWIRNGCFLLQPRRRIRRRYVMRDLEAGHILEHSTEKGSATATEDAAERVDPVQRRRFNGFI
jgi:hypothetical protein